MNDGGVEKMAYEYEESNKQIVFTVDNESSMNQLNKRVKELEEVYRKAKAWNEILDMYKKSNEHENIEDMTMWQSPYEQYIEKLVKKYLED